MMATAARALYPNPEELYEEWQFVIRQGNEYFEAQEFRIAIARYQQAISLATRLQDNYSDFRMAIMAVIVSYHNLADCYLALEQPNQCLSELLSVHEKMMQLIHSVSHQSEQNQDIAFWGARRTYTALMLHKKEHPQSFQAGHLHQMAELSNQYRKEFLC